MGGIFALGFRVGFWQVSDIFSCACFSSCNQFLAFGPCQTLLFCGLVARDRSFNSYPRFTSPLQLTVCLAVTCHYWHLPAACLCAYLKS